MDPSKPAKAVKDGVESGIGKVADLAREALGVTIPGTPGSAPPSLAEPTEPREPLPPKPDQGGPETAHADRAPRPARRPTDARPAGRLPDHGAGGCGCATPTTRSRPGARGPTLLQDHHLREKITHFDHERIPERVVHARGAGGPRRLRRLRHRRGGDARPASSPRAWRRPVFVRFSTVLGSRGSADTVRDTRGFATKFYTDEGTFDLVGNNIPVFFIQDGDQVPRRHPRRPSRIRTGRSRRRRARTTRSGTSSRCTPRRTHHTMWNMSDRGIPRSYRTMEGFGVHTFRLVERRRARRRW